MSSPETHARVGIVGAAGYTGGEALRLVLGHPQLTLAWASSNSFAGQPYSAAHDDLLGVAGHFVAEPIKDVDALLLCMGHGQSRQWLEANPAFRKKRIIDLSQDYRLEPTHEDFIYGLPELNREAIRAARHIANPGCFATAIQLALLPLAAAGHLGEVHISGVTGATGAGQQPSATNHIGWRMNNLSTYKLFTHQHLGEVGQSLRQAQPGFHQPMRFVPYRGPFNRGILITAYTPCSLSTTELEALYNSYYASHPFVHLQPTEPHLKQVLGTNNAVLQAQQAEGMAVITSVIDNLLKGASGQAIQNLNLMLGLDEQTGLQLKAIAF